MKPVLAESKNSGARLLPSGASIKDPSSAKLSLRSKLKRISQKMLRPFVRDYFTPDARSIALEHEADKAQLIALRKRGRDQRSFDRSIPF